MKNFLIYGLKWDEKSVYFSSLEALMKMLNVYVLYQSNEVHQYLLNETRFDINSLNIQDLVAFMNKKKYSRAETNLLIKL